MRQAHRLDQPRHLVETLGMTRHQNQQHFGCRSVGEGTRSCRLLASRVLAANNTGRCPHLVFQAAPRLEQSDGGR